MKLRKVQQGFTLIELMIVIAIIGILAAIAIPAYQNYTIRAQVTEGLTLADGWKTAIAEYYANTGNWPAVANLTGTQASVGKYESGVTVLTGGQIQITYGGTQVNQKLSGQKLLLTPYTNTNNDVFVAVRFGTGTECWFDLDRDRADDNDQYCLPSILAYVLPFLSDRKSASASDRAR